MVGANADGPVVLWGPPQGRVRSAALPAPRFADRGDLLPFARDVARAYGLQRVVALDDAGTPTTVWPAL